MSVRKILKEELLIIGLQSCLHLDQLLQPNITDKNNNTTQDSNHHIQAIYVCTAVLGKLAKKSRRQFHTCASFFNVKLHACAKNFLPKTAVPGVWQNRRAVARPLEPLQHDIAFRQALY